MLIFAGLLLKWGGRHGFRQIFSSGQSGRVAPNEINKWIKRGMTDEFNRIEDLITTQANFNVPFDFQS